MNTVIANNKPSIRSSNSTLNNTASSISSNSPLPTRIFQSFDDSASVGNNNSNNKRPQSDTSLEEGDILVQDTRIVSRRRVDCSEKENVLCEEAVTPVNSASISQPLQAEQAEQAEQQHQPEEQEKKKQLQQQGFSETLDTPNWHANFKAWAFLQSLNPEYKSMYLVKRDNMVAGRSGYVLGRKIDCDLVFTQKEISKTHCLIYMETGAVGDKKGIRIYIDDRSFNGTYINGICVGRNERRMLRDEDEIQLFRKKKIPDDDLRQKFFKILLPPFFEAERCEHIYTLNKVLGRGNFASVHLSNHKETGQEVAIKVLRKGRLVKPKQQKSIQTEIGVMMSLKKHPFIVDLYRVFNEEEKIYLVLEYLPGGELFQLLMEEKSLSEDDTRFIFWQLFTAVQHLHNYEIVHRDIKPENILFANRSTLHVKISDFGLANVEQRDQLFGSQCGTPNYVAPEILGSAEHRAYDKQCDLWSLGVILYICLCGFPPFSEEIGPPIMKMQIKQGLFSFPSPHWDDISEEAKDLVTALLEVNPSDRLTTTQALHHPWMKMNYDVLYNRIKLIDSKIFHELDSFTDAAAHYSSPTQKTVNTQSQLV